MRQLEGLVHTFAADHGLGDDDRARTIVVLEELLTNLSKYGYPNQNESEGTAEVTLELRGDRLTIEFVDDGCAFDPLAQAPPNLDLPVESRAVGGVGLQILRELSDEAEYVRREGRNVIRLSRRVTWSRRESR